MVSAGNSGAMMAPAIGDPGKSCPTSIAPRSRSIVPTTEGLALLIDAGANTEVKAVNLVQFAVMGASIGASRAASLGARA